MSKQKRGRPRKNFNVAASIRNRSPTINLKRETKQSLAIVLAAALAILSTLSLLNISGSLGFIIVKVFRQVFGWGAFLLPSFFALIAIAIYRDLHETEKNKQAVGPAHSYIGVGLLTIVIITFLQLIVSRVSENQFAIAGEGDGGGFVGAAISLGILKTVGPWAGFVLLLLGVVASILITFNIPLNELFGIFKAKENGTVIPNKNNKDTGVKINDSLNNGFKEEPVGTINPVAAKTAQNIPRFINKPYGQKMFPTKQKVEQPAARPINTNWKFPAVNLLDESNASVDSGNIEANVAIIQKTLKDFDIDVEMGEVNVGPTVTQYTLRPAEGIRLSAIVALQNDLKLALAASSIRVEAPIPGKSLVGIEVPNKTTAIVRLRELF